MRPQVRFLPLLLSLVVASGKLNGRGRVANLAVVVRIHLGGGEFRLSTQRPCPSKGLPTWPGEADRKCVVRQVKDLRGLQKHNKPSDSERGRAALVFSVAGTQPPVRAGLSSSFQSIASTSCPIVHGQSFCEVHPRGGCISGIPSVLADTWAAAGPGKPAAWDRPARDHCRALRYP